MIYWLEKRYVMVAIIVHVYSGTFSYLSILFYYLYGIFNLIYIFCVCKSLNMNLLLHFLFPINYHL